MAQSSFTLVPRRTKKLKRIVPGKFDLESALPDISLLGDTIQRITATIVREEINKGNPPSNMIVDNRDAKPFKDADFRIYTIFANTESIAKATLTAMLELKKSTRYLTGRALNSYQIWQVDTYKDPGKLVYKGEPGLKTLMKLAANLKGPEGRLVVVGPMTDYGRKLYWNPGDIKGDPKKKFKQRSKKIAGYDPVTGRTSNARGAIDTTMRDLVIPRIKRRHPETIVFGRWVTGRRVGKLKAGDRWPGIAIGLKQKGKL